MAFLAYAVPAGAPVRFWKHSKAPRGEVNRFGGSATLRVGRRLSASKRADETRQDFCQGAALGLPKGLLLSPDLEAAPDAVA
jgi:hypothetical protein